MRLVEVAWSDSAIGVLHSAVLRSSRAGSVVDCLVKVIEWEEEKRFSSESLSSARLFNPSLLADDPQFHPLDDLAQRSIQRVGYFPQPTHRRIDDASFHAANIRPIEPALVAEALLRVARLFAEFAHDEPDGSCLKIGRLDLPLAPLHEQIRW